MIQPYAYTSVYILPKLNAPDSVYVAQAIAEITRCVKDADIPLVNRQEIDHNTLIIAVGGDGTMLEAMRIASEFEAAAFGVNLGNVGFLTELSIKNRPIVEFDKAMHALLKGEYQHIEQRATLYAVAETERGTGYLGHAVNEVSISQMYADAMVTYRLKIRGSDAGVHKANSLLVSTATGSTAYALAAGGVLMTPEMDAVQIVPVAPTRLTSRPIITSGAPIEVHVWGDGIAIRTDGQVAFRSENRYTEDNPFVVRMTKAKPANVVHLEGWNFFDVLQEKLGWIK